MASKPTADLTKHVKETIKREPEEPPKKDVTENIKREPEEPPKVPHNRHSFTVQFNLSTHTFTVCCTQPQTVLDAIRSDNEENIKCPDDQIILQLGQADKNKAIATHFPCTLIDKGELIVVYTKKDKAEVTRRHEGPVLPKEEYSVFYIETKGGENAKTIAKQKQGLFRSSAIKDFTQLCVYGARGITVKEALESDGRFVNMPDDFQLSNTMTIKEMTKCTQPIDDLHNKTYRISLPRGNKITGKVVSKVGPQVEPKVGPQVEPKVGPQVLQPVKPNPKAVQRLLANKDKARNPEEMYKLLCKQFPELRKVMESRFSGNTFQAALREVDFGKVQQAFKEVFRIKKLLSLGESVCKLFVGDTVQGTGFVLFDNYILTNAHVIKDAIQENCLAVAVKAQFNNEDPIAQEDETNPPFFLLAEKEIIDIDQDLDYAVLKLQRGEDKTVPEGLLKNFGPKPQSGEACIIGHPAGGVKKMDLTFMIAKENRIQSAERITQSVSGDLLTLVINQADSQNIIEKLASDTIMTYDTFMYHGASGSPVFDAEGRVVGLHSAGFLYGFPEPLSHSLIEYAHPVLEIFRKCVTNLKTSGQTALLKEITVISAENLALVQILRECGVQEPEPE